MTQSWKLAEKRECLFLSVSHISLPLCSFSESRRQKPPVSQCSHDALVFVSTRTCGKTVRESHLMPNFWPDSGRVLVSVFCLPSSWPTPVISVKACLAIRKLQHLISIRVEPSLSPRDDLVDGSIGALSDSTGDTLMLVLVGSTEEVLRLWY